MANYRVHTESGAMYTIIEDATEQNEGMTWHRRTPASGIGVLGLTEDHGVLTDKVIVRLGDPMIVPIEMHEDGITFNTYIKTTPVVSAEVL